MTVQTYWPLLLLIAIPFIWQVQRSTTMDLAHKHLQLSVAVRSAVVLLLVLALMQPVVYRSGPWVSVAYVLDVSKSVSPAAVQSAIKWIQQTNGSGNPASVHFVPFGANAEVLETLDQLKGISVADHSENGSIDQSGTNIEAAVGSAVQTFPPHHLKRLVLVTDGNENSGHVTSLLTRLRAEDVRVYTMPLDARVNRDAWIEGIMSPSEIEPEALFPVEAHVYSQSRHVRRSSIALRRQKSRNTRGSSHGWNEPGCI